MSEQSKVIVINIDKQHISGADQYHHTESKDPEVIIKVDRQQKILESVLCIDDKDAYGDIDSIYGPDEIDGYFTIDAEDMDLEINNKITNFEAEDDDLAAPEEIKLKCLELAIQRCMNIEDPFIRDIDAESYAIRYYNFITNSNHWIK